MIQVNIQDAKTNFSRYLDAVESGEIVIVCRHNKPIAELRALTAPAAPVDTRQIEKAPRFGLWPDFGVSESFFEPLDDGFMSHFE